MRSPGRRTTFRSSLAALLPRLPPSEALWFIALLNVALWSRIVLSDAHPALCSIPQRALLDKPSGLLVRFCVARLFVLACGLASPVAATLQTVLDD